MHALSKFSQFIVVNRGLVQAEHDLRSYGTILIESYKQNPFLIGTPTEQSEVEELVNLRLMSLYPLCALTSDPSTILNPSRYVTLSNTAIVPPLIPAGSACLQSLQRLAPFVAQVRLTIRSSTLSATRDLALLTAHCMDRCITTLHRYHQQGSHAGVYNVSAQTGIPYEKLVKGCLIMANDYAAAEIDTSMEQLLLLAAVVHADETDALFSVVNRNGVIKTTARVLEASRASPSLLRAADSIQSDSAPLCDAMIRMWRQLCQRGLTRGNNEPAIQAIQAQILYVMERWSLTADTAQLRE